MFRERLIACILTGHTTCRTMLPIKKKTCMPFSEALYYLAERILCMALCVQQVKQNKVRRTLDEFRRTFLPGHNVDEEEDGGDGMCTW